MAAQDAELKLKVSLDLGFFRQQLTGLGQAAAGYNLPIKVQFDRRSVQSELNALGANIRRRNYRLNIETNLSAEIAKADTLARKLDDLSRKIQARAGGAFARGPQGAAGLEKFMREQGLTGRAFGVQQAQENIAKQAILARIEKGSLSKGGYNVAGLQKIIRDLGGTPTGGRKDLAAQAKKLVEESNGIADAVFDNLKDLQMKLRPIRGQAQTSAARSMPNLNEMLDRMANLTENPRAAQRMLRMLPESRITTGLVGAANRQAVFKEAGPGQFLNLKGKAFDPLLKAIAENFTDYTKSVNASNPWVGKIGSGITQLISRALTQSPEQMFGGRAPIASQKLLPAAGQSSASRMMRSAFSGLPAITAPQIGMENAPLSRAATYMLNKARRALEMPIGPASPYMASPFAGAATVPPRSFFRFGQGPQLPGAPIQAALPPAGTTTNYGGGGFFGYGGVTGSNGGGGRGGAIVPFAGAGGVPPSGGGGIGGLGGFGRAIGGVSLPGAGTIRELGSEFAFATKQVLLFGQAYKMLGFLQDFPGQVGQAVAQLQTFRNTLGAVSTSAEDAAESNQMILDLVDKYNVPLQSARDGFTKLYASMSPAGFSGDEIRDLFTGITQAAATFGMSADKVDRVNYAFAQMASKGQVMSEELKGQLGDVLPGAMALFAEAAGFEGPKAIQEFSAALEDGVYKGEAMNVLLKNVGIVMKQEFGPGAEGAARTFQGVINRMQNSMQLLYESFEPVAIGFLNNVVMPLTEGIKTVSDGFTAFFTGTAAKTAGGFAIAQELEKLRPALDGIRQNIGGLAGQFAQFAKVAGEVGKVFLQIAGSPVVGYLTKLYAIALPINMALNVMRGLWISNAAQLLIFNARVATGTSTLSAFRGMMAATGATAKTTAASIRAAGITLRTFFASTGVGLVVAGISMLIERIMTLNQKMDETRQKAASAGQAIRMMSGTEALAAERSYAGYAKSLEGLNKQLQEGQLKGRAWIAVNRQQAEALKAAGVIPSVVRGQAQVQPSRIGGAYQRLMQLRGEAAYRKRQLDFEEQQAQQAAVLAPIPKVAAEEKAAGKAGKTLGEYDRSRLTFIQQQFEKEKQILDKKLQGELISQTEYDISLAELKLETKKLEIAEKYRLAVEKTNKDNLSAADKALKLKDLEIAKNNDLAIAEENRNIAIGAARQKIIAPILSEIDNETLAIERQAAQADALKEGLLELSAAQEAELSVKERYLSLSQDEREIVKGELDVLRQIREQRLRNAEALRLQLSLQEKINETRGIGGGLRAGFFGQAASVFEQAMLESDGNVDYATQMANLETAAMQLRGVFEGLQSAIGGVSQAFANVLTEGVAGMIAGTATAKEVFADFLKSVGQSLLQAASQMIATYIAIGIAKAFAGFGGGGGGALPSYGGGNVATGVFNQGGIPGLSNAASIGIPTFANGGVVTGPTLGLIGEGKYNEAVVPLPNGKSIPVQFSGERSARDMMSRNTQAAAQASPINLSFETTKIGNTEYVSRDQLEAAMAETRRAAINGGAARGMSMTLDRIQQSPSVRSRIGIR